MTIQEKLFALQDEKYADFQWKLTPGIARELFIGVRVPQCRKLVSEIIKSAGKSGCSKNETFGKAEKIVEIKSDSEKTELNSFLNSLPHKYFEENMLHGILISSIKDFDECLKKVNDFLPYVDNWAVCDTMFPKVLLENKERLLAEIKVWSKSSLVYTCRFGLEMLMRAFLDEDFKPEYLEIPVAVVSNEYYVNMMIAWFFATALAKQWDLVISVIKENRLEKWVHNKTIQKARESFRITKEQKDYLLTLKR